MPSAVRLHWRRPAALGAASLPSRPAASQNGAKSPVAAVKTIKVEIFDQTYTVQGELDEIYVNRLARSVDQKMRAVAETAGTVDTARVAVLTALNLADELEAFRHQRGELRRRVERCVRLVETALRRAD